MKKINLALEYAQRYLKNNESNALAYITLAEAYATMTDDEGFYTNIEKAIQSGFPIWDQLEEPYFEKYVGQDRFKKMLSKYKVFSK
jgi:hypothetical protein